MISHWVGSRWVNVYQGVHWIHDSDHTEVRRFSISINFITTHFKSFQHITTRLVKTRPVESASAQSFAAAPTDSWIPSSGGKLDQPFRWLRQVMDGQGCHGRNSPSSFTTSQKQLNVDEVSISSFSIVSLNRIMGAGWCQHGIAQHIPFFARFERVLTCSCINSNCLPPHLECNLIYWITLDLLLNSN